MGKTTRPVRYDLNKILYDYTVEMMNRLKGLALLNRLPKEQWTEVCNIIQEARKNHPREKAMQRGFNSRRKKRSEKQWRK